MMSASVSDEVIIKHYGLNKKTHRVGANNMWVEFSQLVQANNPVDLTCGFPNYDSLGYMNDMIKTTLGDSNLSIQQYTRSSGHLRLVNVIAKFYSKLMNREINPLDEILVTVGADGSLFNVFSGFLDPNDEIILIEPFYESYVSTSKLNGCCNIRFVALRPSNTTNNNERSNFMSSSEWHWDERELEAAFTNKTKLIVLNTPNNPLGKVYSREELEKVADLCKRHNVLCVSDEVYEHVAYDRDHIRMATLPGMWERTLTICSAGKIFSSTGLKIGWTIAPKPLIRICQVVHTNSVYNCPTFFQEVVARCFEIELSRLHSPHECYFNRISRELKAKRDQFAQILREAGLEPVLPEGGYCMLVDISRAAKQFESDEGETRDKKFAKFLIREKGLATLPSSSFFSKEQQKLAQNYIRICFFKNEDTMRKTANILKSIVNESK